MLEIGVGSGLNLPLYTSRATELLGLDPHPRLLAMASGKPRSVPSKLIEGSAESIPLDDDSVDTVVSTWSLCTIPNVVTALAEIRRVVKHDGQLLFVEHGLASEERVRKWQDRPIAALVEDAGFRISKMETGYMPGPRPMTFIYQGSARPA